MIRQNGDVMLLSTTNLIFLGVRGLLLHFSSTTIPPVRDVLEFQRSTIREHTDAVVLHYPTQKLMSAGVRGLLLQFSSTTQHNSLSNDPIRSRGAASSAKIVSHLDSKDDCS